LPVDTAGRLRLRARNDRLARPQETGGAAYGGAAVAACRASCSSSYTWTRHGGGASAGVRILGASCIDWVAVLCPIGERPSAATLVRDRGAYSARSVFPLRSEQSRQPRRFARISGPDRAFFRPPLSKPPLDRHLCQRRAAGCGMCDNGMAKQT